MHAIRVARMIKWFNPFWYEEPVTSENLDALVELRRAIKPPVVTGKTLYTKMAFREVFEKQAADIVNPDMANCAGILQLKEIAATIQAAATMPNFLITGYFVNFAESGNLICVKPLEVQGGYIRIPTAPGLGIDMNEEALQSYQYERSPRREFRHPSEEQ